MLYKLLCLLVVVQLATARYYKPTLNCPVTQTIQYKDETLLAKDIQVVKVPLPGSIININTVYRTSIVPVTSTNFQILPVSTEQLEVTDVQVVRETSPVTLVQVSTFTRYLTETQVNLNIRTATNFITDVQTVDTPKTLRVTVTAVQTLSTELTHTLPATKYSTVTVTRPELRTSVLVQTVVQTEVVGTSVQLEYQNYTNVHSLTKQITQTICPPPLS